MDGVSLRLFPSAPPELTLTLVVSPGAAVATPTHTLTHATANNAVIC
jgi:hypothetical protein